MNLMCGQHDSGVLFVVILAVVCWVDLFFLILWMLFYL